MRIIGGVAAGLILKAPKGFDVRPTPDLVRQAVFNSLGVRVVGARVLDLFAGTGALGIECLSRGATGVIFVEQANRHAQILRQNLIASGLEAAAFELRVKDALPALTQLAEEGKQFDLILADPPYGEKNIGRRSTSFAQRLLDHASLPSLLSASGLFVLGHTKRDTLSLTTAWQEVKTLKHGDSWMCFLKVASAPSQE